MDSYLFLPGIPMPEGVGFPDGQLIAAGIEEEAAVRIAEAFYNGGDMWAAAADAGVEELNETCANIIERLETHSQYGKG